MGQSYTMNADWWPKKFKKNYEKQAYSHIKVKGYFYQRARTYFETK